jgi:nitrogen fixation protein FixH
MTRRRRSPWPLGITAALVIAVSINLTMVWIAVAHRSPLVPGDPEADALAFDDTLARRRATALLGWNIRVHACVPAPDGACSITLEIADATGHAIDGLEGRVTARRADDARFDRSAELHARGDGRYVAQLPAGPAGAHALTIEIDGRDAHWQDTRELWIPGAR